MFNFFGKKTKSTKKTITKPMGLPSPDVAATTAFGRYLSYGRRAAFGRQYFGARRVPLFGRHRRGRKGVRKTRRGRKGVRKGVRKVKKPTKSLIRQCRKYGIKVTKKVGSRKVYKKISVLKKQLKRKMKLRRTKKTKKTTKKTHRRNRRNRFSLFGFKI